MALSLPAGSRPAGREQAVTAAARSPGTLGGRPPSGRWPCGPASAWPSYAPTGRCWQSTLFTGPTSSIPRPRPRLAAHVDISPEEAARADELIEALGKADLTAYRNEYAAALTVLIEAKTAGRQPPRAEPEPEPAAPGGAVDIMEALTAAVAQARRGADVHHLADRKPAVKKATKKPARKRAG
jgi:hypothetical protein